MVEFFISSWQTHGLPQDYALILHSFFLKTSNPNTLLGITLTLKFIDDYILMPCAIGTFITGLLYSLLTNWGWFKHNWITVKWITATNSSLRSYFNVTPSATLQG